MEASSSSSLSMDDRETEALASLFDAFGSTFSLEEIASAYCQANRNADLAGEILFDKRGNCTRIEESGNRLPDSEIRNPAPEPKAFHKLKPTSASMGSVSHVLGKGYNRSNKSSNVHCLPKKPPKIELAAPLEDEMWSGLMGASSSSHTGGTSENENVQDFLFAMLGDGFQLSNEVISDVLGYCGYDAKKSLNKLLNMSLGNVEKLDERKACNGLNYGSSDLELQVAERSVALSSSGQAMQILQSWYNVFPKGSDEELATPKSPRRKRTGCRIVVTGPPDDACLKDLPKFVEGQTQDANSDNDFKYKSFRKSAKENWDVMTNYYECALDAFLQKDNRQAKYLFEQGKLYHKMYREACEESGKLIHETGEVKFVDVMTLRLHELPPKEALRFLKFNLKSFAGISTFKFLKIIMEPDGEETSTSVRKRLVLKLLEKESIKWTEDGNAGTTITVKLDEIDGRSLTFGKIPES